MSQNPLGLHSQSGSGSQFSGLAPHFVSILLPILEVLRVFYVFVFSAKKAVIF